VRDGRGSRRSKHSIIVLAALVPAVLAFVGYLAFRRPILAYYYLWQAQRHPDDVGPWFELCELGPSLRPTLIDAARRGERGMGKIAVMALECLRRREDERTIGTVLVTATRYADVPLDHDMIDAIGAAYGVEDDQDVRHSMLLFVDDLDFRFQFALWASVAGTHDALAEDVPSLGPGSDQPGAAPRPLIRAAWCETLAPTARRIVDRVAAGELRLHNEVALYHLVRGLAENDCAPDDPDRIKTTLAANRWIATRSLDAIADAIKNDPARAKAWLAPYFRTETECQIAADCYQVLSGSRVSPQVADLFAAFDPRCLRDRCPEGADDQSCRAALVAHLKGDR
jgi:hypothetical protein